MSSSALNCFQVIDKVKLKGVPDGCSILKFWSDASLRKKRGAFLKLCLTNARALDESAIMSLMWLFQKRSDVSLTLRYLNSVTVSIKSDSRKHRNTRGEFFRVKLISLHFLFA